jgi:hypothetical protein
MNWLWKEYLKIFIFVKNPFFAYIFLKFYSESRKIYGQAQKNFTYSATSVFNKVYLNCVLVKKFNFICCVHIDIYICFLNKTVKKKKYLNDWQTHPPACQAT